MNNPGRNECFHFLDICFHIVATKYGKPEIAMWTNKDYLALSNILFKQTGVQISASTLKRIFGKLKTTERYYPQQATRDTLAQYAGFSDWQDFIESKAVEDSPAPGVIEAGMTEAIIQPAPRKGKVRKKWLILLLIILVAVVTVIITQKIKTKGEGGGRPAQLICAKPEGGTPYSAVFKVQPSGHFTGNANNFTVDFGDGHAEQSIIPDILVSHYYEEPGRYYAILKYNAKPCDTVPIYLTTNGWTATANIQHDTSRVFPVNITRLSKTGKLEVNADEVYYAGVDTMRTFFVNFVNTKPLDISGDNFELCLHLTTSQSRPGVRCSQANLTLFGDRSEDMAIFIKPGCVSWSELNFSDIRYSGQKADLSYLGTDFTRGGAVMLRVMNKNVKLFVNGELVFKTTYQYSLQRIYGIAIEFAGIGSIDAFTLKDLITGKTFSDGLKACGSMTSYTMK